MTIGTKVKLDSFLAKKDNYLFNNIDGDHVYIVEDFAYTQKDCDLLIAIRDNKNRVKWVDSEYFIETEWL